MIGDSEFDDALLNQQSSITSVGSRGSFGFLKRGRFTGSAEQRVLREEVEVNRIGDQISFPQPFWFLHQSEQPLKPALLHPSRGHLLVAGVEVEGGADAELHGIDR